MRDINMFLGVVLIFCIALTITSFTSLIFTDKIEIEIHKDYEGSYRIAKAELNQLQSDYNVLEDSKKAICEYKQPTINYLTGIIGLVFGFIGALWLMMIWDKKKILEMIKKIKT